jgi:hypothetical protein
VADEEPLAMERIRVAGVIGALSLCDRPRHRRTAGASVCRRFAASSSHREMDRCRTIRLTLRSLGPRLPPHLALPRDPDGLAVATAGFSGRGLRSWRCVPHALRSTDVRICDLGRRCAHCRGGMRRRASTGPVAGAQRSVPDRRGRTRPPRSGRPVVRGDDCHWRNHDGAGRRRDARRHGGPGRRSGQGTDAAQ